MCSLGCVLLMVVAAVAAPVEEFVPRNQNLFPVPVGPAECVDRKSHRVAEVSLTQGTVSPALSSVARLQTSCCL